MMRGKRCDAFMCNYQKRGKCVHPCAPDFKEVRPYCRNYKEFKRRESVRSTFLSGYHPLDREYFWDTNFPPDAPVPPHGGPSVKEPERSHDYCIGFRDGLNAKRPLGDDVK